MLRGFRDRREAGRQLGQWLAHYAHRSDVLVLALPRGGLPVGAEVARALDAPLDVLVVRKLGVPGQEELAMGAIASAGAAGVVRVVNREVARLVPDVDAALERAAAVEGRELARRERAYRGDRPPPDVRGKTVLLVDDGLATGSTMLAAVGALRRLEPAHVVAAVPVGAAQTCATLRRVADACICAIETTALDGVGRWYADFTQTTDGEVHEILAEAARRPTARAAVAAAPGGAPT